MTKKTESTFLPAVDLKITEDERCALVQTMAWLQNNPKKHSGEKYKFDMEMWLEPAGDEKG